MAGQKRGPYNTNKNANTLAKRTQLDADYARAIEGVLSGQWKNAALAAKECGVRAHTLRKRLEIRKTEIQNSTLNRTELPPLSAPKTGRPNIYFDYNDVESVALFIRVLDSIGYPPH